MPTATRPSLEQIRAQFPALAGGAIYFENAGGSQVPSVVADAIHRYMLTSYVQVGAGYAASKRATETVAAAREFLNVFMNGTGLGRVTFGGSSSGLCKTLADAYADVWQPGDEIIVAQTGHEANCGPWYKLVNRGFVVRPWPVNPHTEECEIEDLEGLLSSRTKLVAFPQTSNLLGNIVDVKAITELAHRAGAKVLVDGVAYAPHRVIDVAAWGCDWYVYSTYKVFGPHMAALFGTTESYAELTGPSHFFIPAESPSKWELGCVNHEGSAGILALNAYFEYLTGSAESPESARGNSPSRSMIEEAWRYMAELELPLQQRLVDFLLAKPDVRIIGPKHGGEGRVGIVSFVHNSIPTNEIVAATDKANIGIRSGHMYAYRLCEGLGIDTATGVVRVSFAHYNTSDEVDQLISVLDPIL